jgi:hypothetical protein
VKKNSTHSALKNLTHNIAVIEWEDAQCIDPGPWVPERDSYAYTPLIVHTVAFVLYDSKEGVVLTDSITEGQTGSIHKIPRKMIKSIVYL